ncbi:MAG: glycosyltransferase family 39 protein [Candidatus Sulfopaludibacter sp.]|nr:glycosyltransferase family 39 protein [Candidatus Sulfopaludibacter sp.]
MILALAAVSALAICFFYSHGWILYYGDAEAHLNTARRIVDNQTPGYDQIGTVWLPLIHVMMLPLVGRDTLWRSGLAGAIPSGFCFVVAGAFLFAAVRRVFRSDAAALTAVGLFALNPNLLYLQSIPMTEPGAYACLMALLYFTVRFRETQGWGAATGAAVAACLGTLARYEGWFLLPFVAAYFFATAKRRWSVTILFCVVAGLGPLFWLFHHWWLTGDPLDFYRGPYSAMAIQGDKPYPGKGDWRTSLLYVRTAIQRCAGPGLILIATAGAVAALVKRAFWPLALLALPPLFYVWSMHSSGNPIFMPGMPYPYSFYNTRYGLSALCLLAFCGAALVSIAPAGRGIAATLVVLAGAFIWVAHPHPQYWITWEESRVNSEGRRAWTHQAAQYLAPRYVPGSGIITSFSDLTGIFREMGVPLRETFSEVNGLPWLAAVERPELYLWQEWAVVAGGDRVQTAVNRANRQGPCYTLEQTIIVKDAPVIEIYRRTGGCHGSS